MKITPGHISCLKDKPEVLPPVVQPVAAIGSKKWQPGSQAI